MSSLHNFLEENSKNAQRFVTLEKLPGDCLNYPAPFEVPGPNTLYRRTDVERLMRENVNLMTGRYSAAQSFNSSFKNYRMPNGEWINFRTVTLWQVMAWYEWMGVSAPSDKQWRLYFISQLPPVDEKGRYAKK